MIRNESSSDRVARVALGLALLCLFFFGPRTPWGLIGFAPLVTGLAGWCPAYPLLGFSSCRTAKSVRGG